MGMLQPTFNPRGGMYSRKNSLFGNRFSYQLHRNVRPLQLSTGDYKKRRKGNQEKTVPPAKMQDGTTKDLSQGTAVASKATTQRCWDSGASLAMVWLRRPPLRGVSALGRAMVLVMVYVLCRHSPHPQILILSGLTAAEARCLFCMLCAGEMGL